MFGSSHNPNVPAVPQRSTARRLAIREGRPDTSAQWWERQRCAGTFPAVGVAVLFWLLATGVVLWRENVLPYREGQSIRYDVVSRADFQYQDEGVRQRERLLAAENAPHVYRATAAGGPDGTGQWELLRDQLLKLPDDVANRTWEQLSPQMRALLASPGALSALQRCQSPTGRANWDANVTTYVGQVAALRWVVLPPDQRRQELEGNRATITLAPGDRTVPTYVTHPAPTADDLRAADGARPAVDDMRAALAPLTGPFNPALSAKVVALTLAAVRPTAAMDDDLSAYAGRVAASNLSPAAWTSAVHKGAVVVHAGELTARDLKLLRLENAAYVAGLGADVWVQRLGVAGVTLLLTVTLAAYTAHYQPKVVRNQARGVAMAALLLSMLLLAELAGMGTGPVYWLAVAPTLLVGMILSIAYEQRFAVGVAAIHAMLVTVGLDQRFGFLLIIWVGVTCTCFQLNDVRTRSKLIEVGGLAAVAMIAITAALGLMNMDPPHLVVNNALYAGAAGLSVGFVTLGILPFVEKSFRITTGMTLLELADASHPLLKRLQVEAPGTYSHSLQVATLAEAAADTIGANGLLCRVASYYHDIGKMNKADYFVENQTGGQQSRHLNLTPSVSFLIIKGHVADGVEMAREYNLPHSVVPFIQQHHGTTLVQYFYHQAREQHERRGEDPEALADSDFRYPGPKPRSKEVGILMLADAAESATRAEKNPTSAKIEWLVHELAMKRLLDGQFDECDLTLRDLSKIERSLTKTLLSLYHGRIAYPQTPHVTTAPPANVPAASPMKLA